MSIYEELGSILSLPSRKKIRVEDRSTPTWNGDVLVYAVGSMVESFGEDTVLSFFDGESRSGSREVEDLQESIEMTGIFKTPGCVSDSAKYFAESHQMWEEAFAEVLISGALSECWSGGDSLESLYESAFSGWVEKLKAKYGFSPSGMRSHRVPHEIREICDEILGVLDESRRATVVDLEALKIAARLLS